VPDASPPDPRQGVFETLLVVEGRAVEIEAHLERLAAGLADLCGGEPPAETRARIDAAAKEIALGRLRLTVLPGDGDRLEIVTAASEVEPEAVFPPWERGASLRSFTVEGGLGAHKWSDRSVLTPAEAGDGTLTLLLDADGTVLEAARANVFCAAGGELATPPTDGRILPGIARARTLEIAAELAIEVREQRLTLADLLAADEVFLTGSVRGIEPVRRIDGTELVTRGGLTARLGGELRRRWLGDAGGQGPAASALS
jgi:para-aminobenzoate synthetase/4-amino-4-deoxychorismate lyase